LLPALSTRRADIGMRKQQSEILLQSAVDGVLQRERDNTGNELGRHAARERAHSTRPGNGLSWIARTGCCLSLCNRYCRSTNQDSREQKNAVALVNSQGRLLSLESLRGGTARQYPKSGRLFLANQCNRSASRLPP